MEKVYGNGVLDYTSEPISLQQFLKDSSVYHHPFLQGPILSSQEKRELRLAGKRTKEDMSRERLVDMLESNLTDSEFQDLENICSAEHLKVEGQPPPLDVDKIKKRSTFYERMEIPPDTNLATIKNVTARRRIHERFLKFSGSIWLDKVVATSGDAEEAFLRKEADMVPGSELIVVVRMYMPFRHQIGVRTHKVANDCHEIVILGKQTLADLRDSFFCVSDSTICQDLSSNPFKQKGDIAKEKYKSAMMYINSVFYNDTRDPDNKDYSKVIREWAEERGLELGTTASMETTRIDELTVRLGYPYVYQHQGNCEHLFCFSDIRLLHQSDPVNSALYPMLRSISKKQSHYCMLCGLYVAKWITIGNERVPHDPCYFCQNCFISYNYVKKKKIGKFAAYPLFDNTLE